MVLQTASGHQWLCCTTRDTSQVALPALSAPSGSCPLTAVSISGTFSRNTVRFATLHSLAFVPYRTLLPMFKFCWRGSTGQSSHICHPWDQGQGQTTEFSEPWVVNILGNQNAELYIIIWYIKLYWYNIHAYKHYQHTFACWSHWTHIYGSFDEPNLSWTMGDCALFEMPDLHYICKQVGTVPHWNIFIFQVLCLYCCHIHYCFLLFMHWRHEVCVSQK